jgi:hypothetical protein
MLDSEIGTVAGRVCVMLPSSSSSAAMATFLLLEGPQQALIVSALGNRKCSLLVRPSSFALSSLRFHLKQPHCSMCMKRLRTDEIDTVSAPSSRFSVQQRVAVSTRQDECVAECLCAWQPSEIDWHAVEITPVSPIYWLAPGSPWVSQQRHSFQPTATGLCTY